MCVIELFEIVSTSVRLLIILSDFRLDKISLCAVSRIL